MTEAAPPKPSTKKDRLLALDMLRGWFLVIILVNHLFYFPSGYDLISGRGQLIVSAAEGFFIVSGLLIGIIRGGRISHVPFASIWEKLWRRGLLLYIWSVGLSFFYILLGWMLYDTPGLKWGLVTPWTDIPGVVLRVLTLDYFYGWADFLRLYAVYIFAAPLAIWLLRKGWWYMVVLLSFLVWLLPEKPVVEADMLFTWQALFFGALIIGYYWQPLTVFTANMNLRLRNSLVFMGVFITITTIALSVISAFFAPSEQGSGWEAVATLTQSVPENVLFHKGNMPITRLMLSFVWFFSFYWLFRRYENGIVAKIGWLLLPLGQNSLQVYIVQSLVIFLMHMWVRPDTFTLTTQNDTILAVVDILLNFVLTSAALAVVWLAAKYNRYLRFIPR